jgi:hypothetical protein
MQPSMILCRTQEAHHRALASAATLDNVKGVANAAAAAWAKEGAAAEHRESRKLRTLVEAARRSHQEPPKFDMRAMSENPDRGHADAN